LLETFSTEQLGATHESRTELSLIDRRDRVVDFRVQRAQSVSSELSKTFSGAPTNKAIWLLIAGTACAIFGAVSLGHGPKA